jgi:hypothetical protein
VGDSSGALLGCSLTGVIGAPNSEEESKMSFKKKIFRFIREFLKDAGIGLALLAAGALAFQGVEDANVVFFGVLFAVLGVVMNLASLVMLLIEEIIFEE